MKAAAMSELKARLREYLDQGKGGSEILITDRGKLPKGFWRMHRLEDSGGKVLQALLEERKAGR